MRYEDAIQRIRQQAFDIVNLHADIAACDESTAAENCDAEMGQGRQGDPTTFYAGLAEETAMDPAEVRRLVIREYARAGGRCSDAAS